MADNQIVINAIIRANTGQFGADLQRQLKNISANVDVNTGSAVAGAAKLSSGLAATQAALANSRTQAAAFSASLAGVGSNAQAGAGFLGNFAAQAGLASRRFLAFSLAAGSFIKLVQVIKEGTSEAISFQTEMNRLAQVSGDSASKIASVQANILELSTATGASSLELAKVSVQLQKAGLSGNEAASALKAIALTDLSPNFESMTKSSEGLIAILKQFKIQGSEMEAAFGSINAVASKFPVSGQDIVSALTHAGSAFISTAGAVREPKEALNEFIGLFTAVKSTTQESADQIATGLRTVFTRFQKSDTVAALKDLGVELRYTAKEAAALGDINLEKQFVGNFEAVKRLSEGLKGLKESDPRFAGIIQNLGGFRQINRVLPLLRDQEDAQKAVNEAQAGGLSLDKDKEKRLESLAQRAAVVGQEFSKIFIAIADSKGFQAFADVALKAASAFGELLGYAKNFLPVIAAIGAVKLFTGIGGAASRFAGSFGAAPGASAATARAFSGGGPVQTFHKGGHVGLVPGVGDTDSVPAYLEKNEFVIKKDSVKKIGVARLNEWNQKGHIPGFAEGGQCASPAQVRYADGGPFSPEKFFAQRKQAELALEQNKIAVDSVASPKFHIERLDREQLRVIRNLRQDREVHDDASTILQEGLSSQFLSRKHYTNERDFHLDKKLIDLRNMQALGEEPPLVDNETPGRRFTGIQDESIRRQFRHRLDARAAAIESARADEVFWRSHPEDRPQATYRSSDPAVGRDPLAAQMHNEAIGLAGGGSPVMPKFPGFLEGGLTSSTFLEGGKAMPYAHYDTGGSTGSDESHRLISYGRRRRASFQELVQQIRDAGDAGNGSDYGVDHNISLAYAALGDRSVRSLVPKGSKFLGSGMVGLAFKTPDGNVIRLQSEEGVQIAKKTRRQNFQPDLRDSAFSAERPLSSSILQAYDTRKIKGVHVEKLPFAESVNPSEADQHIYKLRKALRAEGYNFGDDASRNIGLVNGKAVVIDPGAVTADKLGKVSESVRMRHAAAKIDTFSYDGPIYSPGDVSRYAFGGKPNCYATGGINPRDTIPALVMPGEFIFGADKASSIGRPALEYMNRWGKLPGHQDRPVRGYAKGGFVSLTEAGNVGEAARAQDVGVRAQLGDFRNDASVTQAATAAFQALTGSVKGLTGALDILVRTTTQKLPGDRKVQVTEFAGFPENVIKEKGRSAEEIGRKAADATPRLSFKVDEAHLRGKGPSKENLEFPPLSPAQQKAFEDAIKPGPSDKDDIHTPSRYDRFVDRLKTRVPAFANVDAGVGLKALYRSAANYDPNYDDEDKSIRERFKAIQSPRSLVGFANKSIYSAFKDAANKSETGLSSTSGRVGRYGGEKRKVLSLQSLASPEGESFEITQPGTGEVSVAAQAQAELDAARQGLLGQVPEVLSKDDTRQAVAKTLGVSIGGLKADAKAKKLEAEVSARVQAVAISKAVETKAVAPIPRLPVVKFDSGAEATNEALNKFRQTQVEIAELESKGDSPEIQAKLTELRKQARAHGEESFRILSSGKGEALKQETATNPVLNRDQLVREGGEVAAGKVFLVAKQRESIAAQGNKPDVGVGGVPPGPPRPPVNVSAPGGDDERFQRFLDQRWIASLPQIRGPRSPKGTLAGVDNGPLAPLTASVAQKAKEFEDAVRAKKVFASGKPLDADGLRSESGVTVPIEPLTYGVKPAGDDNSEANKIIERARRAQANVSAYSRGGAAALPAKSLNVIKSDEERFQDTALAVAKIKQGETFGVPSDEIAAREREANLKRAERANRPFIPGKYVTEPELPLEKRSFEYIQGSRQQQLDEYRAKGAQTKLTVEEREAKRAEGTTDPLQVKENVLYKLRNGYASRDVLDEAKQRLSPVQFAQVAKAAEKQGFIPDISQSLAADEVLRKGRNTGEAPKDRRLSQTGARPINLLQPDEKYGFAGGLLGERTDAKAAQVIEQRRTLSGGLLSDSTRAAITQSTLTEQGTSLQRELFSAQRRLLEALFKGAAAHELDAKAAEDTARALSGQAKVSVGKDGRLLGVRDTVNAATAAGVDAPGAGGFGYSLRSGIAGVASSISSGVGGAFRSLANSKANQALGSLRDLSYPALFAAPILASGIQSTTGSAADAVGGGTETSYKTVKSLAGGVSSAALGGVVGGALGGLSIGGVSLGPLGAAAGAVSGALIGLVSSFREAAKEIRDVRIGLAIDQFSQKLQFLNSFPKDSKEPVNPSVVVEAEKSLVDLKSESGESNRIASTGFFSGLNIGEYADRQRRSQRELLGPQTASSTEFLQRQADALARRAANLTAKPEDLVNELKVGPNGSLNTTLIKDVSSARGITPVDLEKELRRYVVSSQRQGNADKLIKEGNASDEKNINAFGRLTSAVQSAADSFIQFQSRMVGLTSILDGTVASGRIDLNAAATQQLGKNANQALIPYQTISAATGDTNLLSAANSANALAAVIPSVLSEIAAKSGIERLGSPDVGVDLRRGVTRSLGGSLTPQQEVGLSSVLARLIKDTHESPEGFVGKVKNDVSAYANELLANYADPIKKAGLEAATILERAANDLIGGLNKVFGAIRLVGETQDSLSKLRVQNERQQIAIAADNAGRGAQALDLIPLETLQRGRQEQSERLTGLKGQDANNPRLIAARLREAQDAVGKATDNQQKIAVEDGGKGPRLEKATSFLLNIQNSAANLQASLKSLSDTTTRSSEIQEKLNRLKDEENSRRGFSERVATASPEELVSINRGLLLLKKYHDQGDSFGSDSTYEDRREALSVGQSLGNATIFGNVVASDVVKNILKNGPQAFADLTPKQKDEKDTLEKKQIEVGKSGEEALALLADFQKQSSDGFFRELKQLQSNFFDRLSASLSGEKVRAAENEIGALSSKSQKLAELKVGADSLALGGVTTSGGLRAFNAASKEVNQFIAAKQNEEVVQEKFGNAKANNSSIFDASFGSGDISPFSSQGQKSLSDQLTKNGLDANEQAEVQRRLRRSVSSRRGVLVYSQKEFEADRDSLRQDLENSIEQTGQSSVSRAYSDRAIKGVALDNRNVNSETLLNLNSTQLSAVQKGADQFKDTPERLDSLNGEIEKTTKGLIDLRAALVVIKQEAENAATRANISSQPVINDNELGGGAGYFARGGLIQARYLADGGNVSPFVAKGTDKIPVMATEGEYLINADAMKQPGILSLVEQINSRKYSPEYSSSSEIGIGLPYKQMLGDTSTVRSMSLKDAIYRAEGGLVNGTRIDRRPKVGPGSIDGVVLNRGFTEEEKDEGDTGTVDGTRIIRRPTQVPEEAKALPNEFVFAPYNPLSDVPNFGISGERQKQSPIGDTFNVVEPKAKTPFNPFLPKQETAGPGQDIAGATDFGRSGDRLTLPSLADVPEFGVEQKQRPDRPLVKKKEYTDEQKTDDILEYQAKKDPYGAASLYFVQERARQQRAAVQAKFDKRFFDANEALVDGEDGEARGRRIAAAGAAERKILSRNTVGEASNNLFYAGGVRNLQARQALASSQEDSLFRVRPESSGQANIGANVLSKGQELRDLNFKRDFNLQEFLKDQHAKRVKRYGKYAAGGLIPGQYTGRDDQTILAQSGEAILTRSAVERTGIANINRLNSGGELPRFATGGEVGNSGSVTGSASPSFTEANQSMDELSKTLSSFVQASVGFGQSFVTLNDSFVRFATDSSKLSEALNNMPRTLTGSFSHSVNVTLNGGELLARISPEIKAMILEETKNVLSRTFKESMPDANIQI